MLRYKVVWTDSFGETRIAFCKTKSEALDLVEYWSGELFVIRIHTKEA